MKKIKRYELDFESALIYFKDNLTDTNTLSSVLIKLVNFKLGRFFTLLPDGSDLKKISQFRNGGIAGGIRDQVSPFVLNRLQRDDGLTCIFDDVATVFRSGYNDPLFLSCGVTYNEEMYYLIDKTSASIQLVNQCFYASNAIWHSLCALSKFNLNAKDSKILALKDIENYCREVRLIIVGAYDGEGYVFWERIEN